MARKKAAKKTAAAKKSVKKTAAAHRSADTKNTNEVMIEIRTMDKWFGTFQALKAINLTVRRQEVVVIIGLFDLLGVANLVLANPIWLGKMFETYVFVAALYWVMCFSLSRYARSLEIKFSAGDR